jgi:hypothetical protein
VGNEWEISGNSSSSSRGIRKWQNGFINVHPIPKSVLELDLVERGRRGALLVEAVNVGSLVLFGGDVALVCDGEILVAAQGEGLAYMPRMRKRRFIPRITYSC